MKVLQQKVAWVAGGGEGLGREVALLLAARGARVFVTGPDERRLGETVGEIANGGGKARHLRGDPGSLEHRNAAAARAREVFGGLDVVVGNPEDEASLRHAAGPSAHFVPLVGDAPEGVVRGAAEVLASPSMP